MLNENAIKLPPIKNAQREKPENPNEANLLLIIVNQNGFDAIQLDAPQWDKIQWPNHWSVKQMGIMVHGLLITCATANVITMLRPNSHENANSMIV